MVDVRVFEQFIKMWSIRLQVVVAKRVGKVINGSYPKLRRVLKYWVIESLVPCFRRSRLKSPVSIMGLFVCCKRCRRLENSSTKVFLSSALVLGCL